jgi:hypothetical protein
VNEILIRQRNDRQGTLLKQSTIIRIVLRAVVTILLLALLARILTFPLAHDEQIHIAAAKLVFDAPLYRTLGYNHLPGLPRLLGTIYALTGTTHLVLVGRLLIFACWLATGAVLLWMAHRAGAGRAIGALACLLLAATPLIGPAGMLVTNNFLPIPFALVSVQCVICAFAVTGPASRKGRIGWAVGSGACATAAVMLKISFVALLPPLAVAMLLAPLGETRGVRLRQIIVPAVLGAGLALLPFLPDVLRDPVATYIHTVRYFVGPHHDYWQQAPGPKAMSLADKVLVAEHVWLSGGALLAGLLAGAIGWIGRSLRAREAWPLALLAAITGSFAMISLAPTPAFPQYYIPAVPFVVMFLVVGYGRLAAPAAARVEPFLVVAGVLALVMIVPRLGALPALLRPQDWTGLAIHRDAMRMRDAMTAIAGSHAGIATLSPIRALEAGIDPYPEFAGGPFVYRVARFIPASERHAYRTTSAADLTRFLDARRPAAILTGDEPALDPPFINYARARGYRPVAIGDPAVRLFVLPNHGSGALPLSSSDSRIRLTLQPSRSVRS